MSSVYGTICHPQGLSSTKYLSPCSQLRCHKRRCVVFVSDIYKPYRSQWHFHISVFSWTVCLKVYTAECFPQTESSKVTYHFWWHSKVLIGTTAREFWLHSTMTRVVFQIKHTCLHRWWQAWVWMSFILSPKWEMTSMRFVWVCLSDKTSLFFPSQHLLPL